VAIERQSGALETLALASLSDKLEFQFAPALDGQGGAVQRRQRTFGFLSSKLEPLPDCFRDVSQRRD
jgi:hypothetical protein